MPNKFTGVEGAKLSEVDGAIHRIYGQNDLGIKQWVDNSPSFLQFDCSNISAGNFKQDGVALLDSLERFYRYTRGTFSDVHTVRMVLRCVLGDNKNLVSGVA